MADPAWDGRDLPDRAAVDGAYARARRHDAATADQACRGDLAEAAAAAVEGDGPADRFGHRLVVARAYAQTHLRPWRTWARAAEQLGSLSWPDRLVAVDLALDETDRTDLTAEGWRVVPAGAKLISAVRQV